MTRQLPKPVAVPLGWVICGCINGVIYTAGWVLLRWDSVGVRVEEWLKDGTQ